MVNALCKTFHDLGTGCLRKELKLIEILVGLALVLRRGYQSHQNCSFFLSCRYYKFFHQKNTVIQFHANIMIFYRKMVIIAL